MNKFEAQLAIRRADLQEEEAAKAEIDDSEGAVL
jgi:hypothetical protein